MSGVEGNAASVIDGDESRLRVMAGCAATIIAGWTIYAASQIAGASGQLRWRRVAVCFWSAVFCAAPLARAFRPSEGSDHVAVHRQLRF